MLTLVPLGGRAREHAHGTATVAALCVKGDPVEVLSRCTRRPAGAELRTR
jgi:hypothetical protein